MRSLKSIYVIVKAIIFVLGVLLLPIGSVAAQSSGGSQITVMVCPTTTESAFTVTTPQSDSVVGRADVAVSGGVKNISQIDFFVDDIYNNTVAIGYTDTAFATVISLAPGTHTLKMTAYDSCHQTSHTNSLVLTYEPTVTNQTPANRVKREIDNSNACINGCPNTESGLVSSGDPASVSAAPSPSKLTFPIVPHVDAIASNQGSNRDNRAAVRLVNVEKTTLAVGAVILLAVPAAPVVVAQASYYLISHTVFAGFLSPISRRSNSRRYGRKDLLVRLAGLALLIVAFIF